MGVQVKFKNLTSMNVIPEYVPKKIRLTGVVMPEGAGSIEGLGEYYEGKLVNLHAVVNDGYYIPTFFAPGTVAYDSDHVQFNMPAFDTKVTLQLTKKYLAYRIGYDAATKTQTERKDIAVIGGVDASKFVIDGDLHAYVAQSGNANVLSLYLPADNTITGIKAYEVTSDGTMSLMSEDYCGITKDSHHSYFRSSGFADGKQIAIAVTASGDITPAMFDSMSIDWNYDNSDHL